MWQPQETAERSAVMEKEWEEREREREGGILYEKRAQELADHYRCCAYPAIPCKWCSRLPFGIRCKGQHPKKLSFSGVSLIRELSSLYNGYERFLRKCAKPRQDLKCKGRGRGFAIHKAEFVFHISPSSPLRLHNFQDKWIHTLAWPIEAAVQIHAWEASMA